MAISEIRQRHRCSRGYTPRTVLSCNFPPPAPLHPVSRFDRHESPPLAQLLEDAFLDTGGSWELLDAYTPTIVRADMHGTQGDGAHYCIPGPVDHWITLLYNILLVKTSVNDF